MVFLKYTELVFAKILQGVYKVIGCNMQHYRAVYCHSIDHRQINKIVIYGSRYEESVKKRFQDRRKSDPNIQEAGLNRVSDGVCVDEYIGYI